MYRVFVLFLVASLGLPAVPVSGCDCNQKQTNQFSNCCCKTQDSKQTQNDKPCCCKNLQPNNTIANHPQCKKQDCDCRQVFSQPATATSIKSIKLTQQPHYQFMSVESIARISRLTSTTQPQTSYLAYAHSSSESCAHFCLWQI